jgi:hypothetical protein
MTRGERQLTFWTLIVTIASAVFALTGPNPALRQWLGWEDVPKAVPNSAQPSPSPQRSDSATIQALLDACINAYNAEDEPTAVALCNISEEEARVLPGTKNLHVINGVQSIRR